MCVKQTIITANINEEETVLHIYPMLLFCFFVHPICKLFCPQKLAGINIIHSQNNRLILLNSNFHALQKQEKRYLMQVYSFLVFYVLRLMFQYIAVVIFVLVIYMIPHWRIFTFETSCIHINAVYLRDDPWGAQNTDPC